jgi:hypothetical protein
LESFFLIFFLVSAFDSPHPVNTTSSIYLSCFFFLFESFFLLFFY